MNVIVASLKFSPGHLSHIVAYGKLFREIGNGVTLWLDQGYAKLDTRNEFPVLWYPKTEPKKVDILFLVNASTKNHFLCRNFKKKGARIIYLYHEPWESFGQYLKEGLKQALKATAAHYFSTKVLPFCDLVIVPSEYALGLYKRHDVRYNNKVIKIPLLFDDELRGEIDLSKKEYFSYIGHAVKGHAFDEYIAFIKYAYAKGVQFKFEIATRTDLGSLLKRDRALIKMENEGILRISHGRPLTNEEINQAYERSFCVWNLYRRSTQSGVLPKAFMFGTPVIATRMGSFPEYVSDTKNGFLMGCAYRFEDLLVAAAGTKKDIQVMAKHCRATFKKVFYWKSWLDSDLVKTVQSLL